MGAKFAEVKDTLPSGTTVEKAIGETRTWKPGRDERNGTGGGGETGRETGTTKPSRDGDTDKIGERTGVKTAKP